MPTETAIKYRWLGLCEKCGQERAKHSKSYCLSCLAKKKKHSDHALEKYYLKLLTARSKPCVDCGITLLPNKMEFDHVRGDKLFELGNTRNKSRTDEEIQNEIAKCDIRCKSCHRMRHYRIRQGLKSGNAT